MTANAHPGALVLTLIATAALAACNSMRAGIEPPDIDALAYSYAEAWSSQDPAQLAAFYAEDGRLTINDGTPSIGRGAVEATAASFMLGFPDMRVERVNVQRDGDEVVFYWRWTGTNSGAGGTGNAVDLTGYEVWTLGEDGLILESRGYFDEEEYERQLNAIGD